jgi:hypothetical protein
VSKMKSELERHWKAEREGVCVGETEPMRCLSAYGILLEGGRECQNSRSGASQRWQPRQQNRLLLFQERMILQET